MGDQRKQHKYVARVKIGKRYRYFYTQAQLKAYQMAKAAGNKISEAATNAKYAANSAKWNAENALTGVHSKKAIEQLNKSLSANKALGNHQEAVWDRIGLRRVSRTYKTRTLPGIVSDRGATLKADIRAKTRSKVGNIKRGAAKAANDISANAKVAKEYLTGKNAKAKMIAANDAAWRNRGNGIKAITSAEAASKAKREWQDNTLPGQIDKAKRSVEKSAISARHTLANSVKAGKTAAKNLGVAAGKAGRKAKKAIGKGAVNAAATVAAAPFRAAQKVEQAAEKAAKNKHVKRLTRAVEKKLGVGYYDKDFNERKKKIDAARKQVAWEMRNDNLLYNAAEKKVAAQAKEVEDAINNFHKENKGGKSNLVSREENKGSGKGTIGKTGSGTNTHGPRGNSGSKPFSTSSNSHHANLVSREKNKGSGKGKFGKTGSGTNTHGPRSGSDKTPVFVNNFTAKLTNSRTTPAFAAAMKKKRKKG